MFLLCWLRVFLLFFVISLNWDAMSSAPTTPKPENEKHPFESPSVSGISVISTSSDTNIGTKSTITHLHHKAYSEGGSDGDSKNKKTRRQKQQEINSNSNHSHIYKSNKYHNKSKSLTPKRKPNKGNINNIKEYHLNQDENENEDEEEDDDEKTPPTKLTLDQSVSKSNPKRLNRPKHFKKGAKSVAFALDNDYTENDKIADLPQSDIASVSSSNINISTNTKRRKVKARKRKSITPGHTIQKQLQKHLGSVNQHLLPAPKKQFYYKWYIYNKNIYTFSCEFAIKYI